MLRDGLLIATATRSPEAAPRLETWRASVGDGAACGSSIWSDRSQATANNASPALAQPIRTREGMLNRMMMKSL